MASAAFTPAEEIRVLRGRRTQEEFARLTGLSIETLRNWEQGKREPTGPGRALLKIIARVPELAFEILEET